MAGEALLPDRPAQTIEESMKIGRTKQLRQSWRTRMCFLPWPSSCGAVSEQPERWLHQWSGDERNGVRAAVELAERAHCLTEES